MSLSLGLRCGYVELPVFYDERGVYRTEGAKALTIEL